MGDFFSNQFFGEAVEHPHGIDCAFFLTDQFGYELDLIPDLSLKA